MPLNPETLNLSPPKTLLPSPDIVHTGPGVCCPQCKVEGAHGIDMDRIDANNLQQQAKLKLN